MVASNNVLFCSFIVDLYYSQWFYRKSLKPPFLTADQPAHGKLVRATHFFSPPALPGRKATHFTRGRLLDLLGLQPVCITLFNMFEITSIRIHDLLT